MALDLPATPQRLVSTLTSLSRYGSKPFGAQVILDESAIKRDPRTSAGRAEKYFDLSGLTTMEALTEISKLMPEYEVVAAAVPQLRPRRFAHNTAVALNRQVNHLQATPSGVSEALVVVHRVFDPAFTLPVGARGKPRPPLRLADYFDRPVQLAIDHQTVSDLLDQICVEYGRTSWLAEYKDASGAYRGLNVMLMGQDNWDVNAEAHIQ
jgi:hypothetical protein